MTCPHCTSAGELFGSKTARRELKSYRKKGPSGTTGWILDRLRALGLHPDSHLDIGAGVGALYHETLADGAAEAVHVDASDDYIEAARREAERRGHADRVRYLLGDYVELADQIREADLVTMDRVICCYPDVGALVDASARKARKAYAVSYLRDRWWVAVATWLGNLYLTLRRSDFRVYLHPTAEVDREAARHGLRPVERLDGLFWHATIYLRSRPS